METGHNAPSSAFARAESIISEVRDAEKKADAVIEKAKRDSEQIVADARAEAALILAREDEVLSMEHGKKFADMKAKSEAYLAAEVREAEKEAASLAAMAKKGHAKAVAHIIASFEGMISDE